MRDFYQVLREKELQIIRIQQEIEALRAIIPLLADDTDKPEAAATAYPPFRVVNSD